MGEEPISQNPLAGEIVAELKRRGKTLSVAESFTGGGVTREIVSVPGASTVLFEGAVCYNERAKVLRLGVKEETLKTYGAVSEQTAREMAEGLLSTGNCAFALATTGSAGPTQDGTAPVGTFYIAVGNAKGVQVFHHLAEGDRDAVTKAGISFALTHLLNRIKNS